MGAPRCKVCRHRERNVLDEGLRAGWAPRSLVRRYSDVNRKALARHRDERHHEKSAA